MPPTPVPRATTLLVALPLALGAFALLLVGLCLWHRQARRIRLGSVMGRAARGYTGRRRRRDLFRLGRVAKDGGDQASIPLAYRDEPSRDRPRRDSDALGSLAASPVDAVFDHGGKNAFREEVRRQEHERRDEGAP
ncbi:hypothetical protein CDD83_6356 [Cordyceps sp. RAO-2017]|nr:hypothetical protein CDD83_6356 [Cordyceps sp. RAO-2017]